MISKFIVSKTPQMFCKEFQVFKTTFLDLILDNSLTRLQNQKLAHEKWKYFLTILIFKIKLKFIAYFNLFYKVTSLVTLWVGSSIISSDSHLTQKIIKETIEVENKKWIEIELISHISELMVHLKDDLYF